MSAQAERAVDAAAMAAATSAGPDAFPDQTTSPLMGLMLCSFEDIFSLPNANLGICDLAFRQEETDAPLLVLPPWYLSESIAMKRPRTIGFSLLEVIAAVIILAVVAAASVATVAPMRAKSEERQTDREIATLNATAQSYFLEQGRYPASVMAMAEAGFLANSTGEDQAKIEQILRRYDYSSTTGIFSKK